MRQSASGTPRLQLPCHRCTRTWREGLPCCREGRVASAAHFCIVTGRLWTRGDAQTARAPLARLMPPDPPPGPRSQPSVCRKWHPWPFTSLLGSDSSLITCA